MSRRFAGTATDGSVEIDASPIVTFPLTVSAWGLPLNTTVFKEVVNISANGDANNWLVRLAFNNVGTVRVYSRDSGTNDGEANTSTSYVANAWQHVCGTFTSAGRAVYLNGGGKGTNAVAKAPTGVNRLAVGRAGDSTPSDPMTGWIADVAIWNSVLTDVQILMLARGVHPCDIGPRPYLYFPLGRGSAEIDEVRGAILRPVGTLSYPTPNFRPPQLEAGRLAVRRWLDAPAAAGGGPTTYNQSASGSITATGALAKQTGRSLVGSIAMSAAGLLKDAAIELAGTIASAGSLTKRVARSLTGSITSAGSLAGVKTALVSLAGSIATTGALARRTSKASSGSIASSGTLLKMAARSLVGSVASAGTLFGVKTALVSLTGSIALTGALVRRTSKAPNGSIASSGALLKMAARSLVGSVASSGTVSAIKTALKSLTGAIASAGTLTKRTGKVASGSISSSGTLQRRTARSLTGSLATAGLLGTVKAALVSLVGTLASAGTLTRQAQKPVAGTVASSGALQRLTGKGVGGVLTSAGSLLKRTACALVGALGSAGTLASVGGGGIPSLGVFEAASTSTSDDTYETE